MLKLKIKSCEFYWNEQITKKGKQNKNQGVFSRLHKSFFSFLIFISQKVVTPESLFLRNLRARSLVVSDLLSETKGFRFEYSY